MENSGPYLNTLTRRLAEMPADFLDEPRIGRQGRLVVAALVHDLLRQFPSEAAPQLDAFASTLKQDRNRLQIIAVACWLLADPFFLSANINAVQIESLLAEQLNALAQSTQAEKIIHDPERREELARVILSRLNYRPEGESKEQAIDRLSALSSTERKRLLEESRAAEKRAREIREALVRKAAQASADKWSRE